MPRAAARKPFCEGARRGSGRCVGGLDAAARDGEETRRRVAFIRKLGACGGLDEVRVGRGQDHLPAQLPKVAHEEAVPLWIELAGDVVEQQEGSLALRTAPVLDFADLEGEDQRPALPLARVESGGPRPDPDSEVVGMRSHGGEAALAVAGK